MVCFTLQKPYRKVNTRGVLSVVSVMRVMSVGFVVKIYHKVARMYSVLSVVSFMTVVIDSMLSV